MNKVKGRQLPKRPDSLIYETVDPSSIPSDENEFLDSFDEEDDQVEEPIDDTDYLNASDVTKAKIVPEQDPDDPPPPPPRMNQHIDLDNDSSTFHPKGRAPVNAIATKSAPKPPPTSKITPVARQISPPSRPTPQPPSSVQTRQTPQPPITRAPPAPPSDFSRPLPTPAAVEERMMQSTSSSESYEYVDDLPSKYDSDDEKYEIPDDKKIKAKYESDDEKYEVPDEEKIKKPANDLRKQSLPNIIQLPNRRQVPPLPPVEDTPTRARNQFELPQPVAWPNSRLLPPVPVVAADEIEYEIERSSVPADSKNSSGSIAVNRNQILTAIKSLNPVNDGFKPKSVNNLPVSTNNEINQPVSFAPQPIIPVKRENSNATINSINWKNAEKDPMVSCGWYFPQITRINADQEITKLKQDGSFLVRKSQTGGDQSPYSITVLCQNKIYNLKIRKRLSDGLYALGKEKQKEQVFGSVAELISFHTNNPIDLVDAQSGQISGSVKLKTWPKKG